MHCLLKHECCICHNSVCLKTSVAFAIQTNISLVFATTILFCQRYFNGISLLSKVFYFQWYFTFAKGILLLPKVFYCYLSFVFHFCQQRCFHFCLSFVFHISSKAISKVFHFCCLTLSKMPPQRIELADITEFSQSFLLQLVNIRIAHLRIGMSETQALRIQFAELRHRNSLQMHSILFITLLLFPAMQCAKGLLLSSGVKHRLADCVQ